MMPKVIGSSPVLLVADVVAAANYYRDQLGFSEEQYWGDPPSFCILQRDAFHLMLRQIADRKQIAPNRLACPGQWDAYFWVDDVDTLYQQITDGSAEIAYELCVQPYGCREFGVRDLDGYELAFGQDLDGAIVAPQTLAED